jgi:hypothetical protein
MRKSMKSWNSTALLLLFVATLGHAQNDERPDQETVRQLVEQVKVLQDRVKALESEQSPKAATTPPVSPEAANAAQESQDTEARTAVVEQTLHELRGIQWRGFGEADYKVLNQRKPELGTFGFVPGSHGNFYTGDFDLLLTSRIFESDRASVLAEITFGEGDAQTFGVDMERVLFKYDWNDHARISLGRYHTAIGYYNTAFHSGSWLQTAADRPLIMEFANDAGPLPTQAVGVSVTGTIPSGRLDLNYIAEYGSSDTVRPDIHAVSQVDENNGNHINFGLFVRPAFVPGLQIGGSIYHDQISDFRLGSGVRLGQTIANGHVVYAGHGVEFLNEGFLIRHVYGQGSAAYNMPAFYSQISKRFGRVRPYFRYQYINANPGSLFQDIALRRGPSVGVRYDLSAYIAFKAQWDHTLRKGESNLDGLHSQLAFTF